MAIINQSMNYVKIETNSQYMEYFIERINNLERENNGLRIHLTNYQKENSYLHNERQLLINEITNLKDMINYRNQILESLDKKYKSLKVKFKNQEERIGSLSSDKNQLMLERDKFCNFISDKSRQRQINTQPSPDTDDDFFS